MLINPRKKTKTIKIGNVTIGGRNKIAVQSMCNTSTKNVKATVKQIKKLEALGCELVRIAVADMQSAKAIKNIKKQIKIPLVADIHFDYKLALESVRQGADKIRINPGNIRDKDKVKLIAETCAKKIIPVRIGVNAGSISAIRKLKSPPRWTPEKWAQIMVEDALKHIELVEKYGLKNIVVSLKADDIYRTYLACRLFAKHSNIPQHIGITESGSLLSGTIKSSIGLGLILREGIGDTIRVSLSDKPEKEIITAFEILKSLGLRKYGAEIIACPTCARCAINVSSTVKKLENKMFTDEKLRQKSQGIKIAVMGCSVNGPGEAKTSDIGITGSKNFAYLFKKGKIVKKIKKTKLFETLLSEIKKIKN